MHHSHFSKYVKTFSKENKILWALSYSSLTIFYIDATDRSKINGNQERFFIPLRLYPLLFFANTPFKRFQNYKKKDNWKLENNGQIGFSRGLYFRLKKRFSSPSLQWNIKLLNILDFNWKKWIFSRVGGNKVSNRGETQYFLFI